ncbi:MAG TPA: YafY family protein [Anaerolineales bacterium]|nr:YafY family protein [Anaerolineales bacterium]HRF49455.1 YafY family protein [Anaerolineales bacterium]
MNRTDRLLALILELQRGGPRTAAALAARFETSKRTIYRDLDALGEAGVPLISTPGRGYELDPDYFLPPLRFTPDEATLLLLGADVMAQSFDAHYKAAAQAAGAKIEAVLPQGVRAEVEYLRENIRFITHEGPDDDDQRQPLHDRLRVLRRAIIGRHRVRFRYFARQSRSSQPGGWREADPYSLANVSGSWYLVALDHARRDLRHFRLERIEALIVLAHTFNRPKRFRVAQAQPDDRHLVVRVRFAPAVARYAQESRPFFWVADQVEVDHLVMTLRVRGIDDLIGWVLSWGDQAEVLEPVELRERLCAIARGLSSRYGAG